MTILVLPSCCFGLSEKSTVTDVIYYFKLLSYKFWAASGGHASERHISLVTVVPACGSKALSCVIVRFLNAQFVHGMLGL
jgi:hypothetical protein